MSHQVHLSQWALYRVGPAKAASKQRQVARWLKNGYIQPSCIYPALIRTILKDWEGECLYLALDSSQLWERFTVVRVALIYRGRAQPISWVVLPSQSATAAFATYRPILEAAHCSVVLLADRGFFHGCLLCLVRDLGWGFRIRLNGESYGTTAEQVYLQRHAAHVRTMVLEGVSLLDVPMFERMPRSSQEALDLLVGRCRADLACNAAYPNLSAEVKALLAQLEKQPVELSLINPHTGLPFRLTRNWLVLGIHNLLLLTPTAVQLPGLLHQAYLGDWSVIARLLSNAFAPDSPQAEWIIMNLTIICHEDWARTRRAETARFSTESYMRYEDVRTFLAPEQVCALIPRPQPEALYQPVSTSSIPVLIISDQADPQNPPENVANAKEHYPNSLGLVAPGQGHGYTGFTCRDQILADFIEKGTTQGLNAECLQQEPLPPFN